MSIIGLTDRPILRRDGKIRAGYKDETTKKLVNTDYFLFDDAPQLAGIYGETATEVFFTVHSDNPTDFMKADLRWYNASQLLCMSMHNAPGDNGQPMGSVAAYFGVGADVQGLQQLPFPGIQKSRKRTCNYKSCPEYVKGQCGEHMFFDMIVPQYSMGALFTLDSTSINAIINAHSTFNKAWTRYGGKLTGQIFRMYKKPGEIKYQKSDGSTGKREAPMVYFDMVNFEEYEAKYKESIRSEDWEALLSLRGRSASLSQSGGLSLAAPVEAMQIESADTDTLRLPSAPEADPIATRANDPSILPYFEEYAKLLGREATEQVRIATMRNIATVAEGITYLKNKIKETKKQQAKTTTSPDTTQQQAPTTSAQSGGGLY